MMAVAVCLMTACEKLSPDDAMAEIENEKAEEVVAGRQFTFTIKGDFENEMKTRGILSANGSDMSDLWMFDYVGDELVQQLHLTPSDENFDAPTITLSYASHHVYRCVSRYHANGGCRGAYYHMGKGERHLLEGLHHRCDKLQHQEPLLHAGSNGDKAEGHSC